MIQPSNPPFASKLPPMCNAWIMLSEDDPSGTNYNSPTSAFQRLISERLYQANDIINLCFVDIVPTSSKTIPVGDGSSYTLFLDKVTHPKNAEGPTDQDYMEWIIRDARKANPKIKICLTLLYGKQHLISQIYPDPVRSPIIVADVNIWQSVIVQITEGSSQTPIERSRIERFAAFVQEGAVSP